MTAPAPTVIADGTVVTIHYTLASPDGDVIDSSDGVEPMDYLHGAENIVPGLEKQLTGKAVGDSIEAVVPPAEGYGDREGPEPQKVPLSEFPDDTELAEGLQIVAQAEDEEPFPLWVAEMGDDFVMLDHNHPLAGVTLHFSVKVEAIRAATEEEVAHGHPHGPGGHHHH